MISSNKFSRTSSTWDTSCSVAILTSTWSDSKVHARFGESPYRTAQLITLHLTSCAQQKQQYEFYTKSPFLSHRHQCGKADYKAHEGNALTQKAINLSSIYLVQT